jgi:hypothetical protein
VDLQPFEVKRDRDGVTGPFSTFPFLSSRVEQQDEIAKIRCLQLLSGLATDGLPHSNGAQRLTGK